MELNRELCTSCQKLSQQAGWTIVLEAAVIFGIVLFNSRERSELTSILTSAFTSDTSVLYNFVNSVCKDTNLFRKMQTLSLRCTE